MPDPPLSPSQQVERIREILVGRQMQQIEERLQRLETSLAEGGGNLASEFAELRKGLQDDALARATLVEELATRLTTLEDHTPRAASPAPPAQDDALIEQVRHHLEDFTLNMAARIDSRANEVLQHLESELTHLRVRVENDINLLHEQKCDRHELRQRFSKLAMAAMEEPPAPSQDVPEEFIP